MQNVNINIISILLLKNCERNVNNVAEEFASYQKILLANSNT